MKKIFLKTFLVSFLLLFIKPLTAQTLAPASEYKVFYIYYDKDWTPLLIACGGTGGKSDLNNSSNKIWTVNGVATNRYQLTPKSFRSCDFIYNRVIRLTVSEALNYTTKRFTKVSTSTPVWDYYYSPTMGANNICVPSPLPANYNYNQFTTNSGELAIQTYMQRADFMGLSKDGKDTIGAQGYVMYMDSTGVPMVDRYYRSKGDYKMIGVCDHGNYGRSDDFYEFFFYYKGKEYMRILNANTFKAFFVQDPGNSKKAMAVVLRDDGSVDYIAGEFQDLLDRYLSNSLPRVETNTTKFVTDFLTNNPNLIFWSLAKPYRGGTDGIVRAQDFANNPSLFAEILTKIYLEPQKLWATLIDNENTWVDPSNTKILVEDF
ncbi:MAG: hypothetical protein NT021_06700 [Sphingobacteriales bacterium]|nr:hypothetical protein [Sphingobacteriales bacterium]